MIVFNTTQSWTLCGLIGAFIDLALAYFLLCGSVFAFFTSKFCNVFGLHLPCPCTGLFGYQNRSMCLHRLLIEWPTRKISSVQMLIKSRFPFDLIWFQNQPRNFEMMLSADSNYDNGVLGLENEASSSSFPSSKWQNLVDGESRYDAKGKKIVNQKQRHGVRRRRRSALLYGKSSTQLVVADGSSSAYNGSDMRSQIDDCSNPVTGKEDALKDNANSTNGLDMDERTWYGFEQSGSYGKTKVKDNDSASVEKFVCNVEDKSGNAGSEENRIRMLESALEEERVACAALYLELEKERAAAATATDEAMSMILRLQADKAAIEMEARQYQRMIEEKFAYEEEEMDILKEILVRREKEIYFLEKEVEAYRQMKCLENEQSEVDFSQMTSEWGQKPLDPHPNKDHLPVPQEVEKSKSITKNKAENGTKSSAAYDASSAEITSEAAQTCNSIKSLSCSGDKLEKDMERGTEVHDNLHCSMLSSEPFVYDVHVIDDKTELRKEDNCKESGLSNSVASDFGFSSGELLSNGANIRVAETNQYNHRSSFDMKYDAPVLGNSQSKNLLFDADGDSSSAASSERLKLDTEVEFLRERLRKVQEGKEKLTFSADHREIIHAQLKLVEEIVNHLGQIQQLREPRRQTSLPPSSSKASLKKRRCQSVCFEAHESS